MKAKTEEFNNIDAGLGTFDQCWSLATEQWLRNPNPCSIGTLKVCIQWTSFQRHMIVVHAAGNAVSFHVSSARPGMTDRLLTRIRIRSVRSSGLFGSCVSRNFIHSALNRWASLLEKVLNVRRIK